MGMKTPLARITDFARMLVSALSLVCLASAVWAAPLWAAEMHRSLDGLGERLVLWLDAPASQARLARSDVKNLTLTGLPHTKSRNVAAEFKDGLLASVKSTTQGLEFELRTPAFGFVLEHSANGKMLTIHLFDDPFGANWKPRASLDERKPAAVFSPKTQQTKKAAGPRTPPAPKPKAASKPAPTVVKANAPMNTTPNASTSVKTAPSDPWTQAEALASELAKALTQEARSGQSPAPAQKLTAVKPAATTPAKKEESAKTASVAPANPSGLPEAMLRSWHFALSVRQNENLYDLIAEPVELPQPEPSAPHGASM